MSYSETRLQTGALELSLRNVFERVTHRSPDRLKKALEYALFPGGGRVRPKLCLEVFESSGGTDTAFALNAAAAVEFLHCGSLVHDDLPCFDDAAMRRGKPTLHLAFDQGTAVLVGDGLICAAFEAISSSVDISPWRTVEAVRMLGQALGSSTGLVAGQAMESEGGIPVARVHQAKTGALFEVSAALGALAAGVDSSPWRMYGRTVGRAYQLADDLMDLAGEPAQLGKTTLRDVALDRPNAVRTFGQQAVVQKFHLLVDEAIESIPDCHRPDRLVALTRSITGRLFSGAKEKFPVAPME